MTLGTPRVGAYGLKIRAPKDPQAFQIGRIVQVTDTERAVLICRLTSGNQWGAQKLSNGELCIITAKTANRSDFPIVGNYTTELALF